VQRAAGSQSRREKEYKQKLEIYDMVEKD